MTKEYEDLRLIEDYLPIEAISAEASREKSVRKGHISTLHLWWARRPLVACRAAVYGALVPADRWVKDVKLKNPPEDTEKAERVRNGKKLGLNRRAAGEFVTRLCKYPGEPRVIAEAQKHILEAHAERLTAELAEGRIADKVPGWVEEFEFVGEEVTYDDIVAGNAPRPRILDMFAGGGAIPLEALRLGCEAHALDLNPVAHIIELCTLVYPQKYGKPDPSTAGMTGPRGSRGKPTWGGLAGEVRYWGERVLEKVKAEIGDLYPLVPDPAYKGKCSGRQASFWQRDDSDEVPPGYLVPVAYLWTRTVTCKNPKCKAIVPLVRQTWLCKKKDRYVALKATTPEGAQRIRFEVANAATPEGLRFDPSIGSEGGNAQCPFCHTVADAEYVQAQGLEKRTDAQLLAVVCTRPNAKGKTFLAESDLPPGCIPESAALRARIDNFCRERCLTVPCEPISPLRPSPNARGLSAVTRHGFGVFGDLFSPRQQLVLLAFADAVRQVGSGTLDDGHARAVATCCAFALDKVLSRYSTFSPWDTSRETVVLAFGKHMLPMVWDYAEPVPIADGSGGWRTALEDVIQAISNNAVLPATAHCERGNAAQLPATVDMFDAVITDPPYYDNIPYADVSDFFYVWLKRSIGHLYPEDFASQLTPKKAEATAIASRHGGDMEKATSEYESVMLASFREAARVLKPGGPMAIVYAHKTTLGWATLVDALRQADLTVTEAWPLDTEYGGHLKSETASLTSSIFLVARRRIESRTGSYEEEVRRELEAIVRERVATLWDQGVSGADLVIACVGAGLRAFTRFACVEYANGEEVPAERFLSEVEAVVLDSILARMSKEVGGNGGRYSLAGVDPGTRFYILWRYTYKAADLDAGEAIVFANGTHVELDGANGLSSHSRAIIEKKKGKYRLRDFAERGADEHLGTPAEDGQASPLIDALHRTLWLMENRPGELSQFLREAQPNREQMRLVAQALAGPALKGGELSETSPSSEQAALAKLTANWRSVVEDAVTTAGERIDQKRSQQRMFE